MKKVRFEMFVKKFTACVLAAAMTISTPLTAFATEFSDNFSQPGGTNGSDSETDTISSTDTNTTVLNEKNRAKITGLMIYGPDSITMLPKEQEVITAAVLTNDKLEDDVTIAQLNKKIRWRSSDPKVVSISAKSESMNKCTLNARNTGTATITASLDADQDGKYDYTASVEVKVFQPSRDNIRWNITDADKFYVKHTYTLSEYLVIDGDVKVNAVDVVTFAVKGSSKVATISGDKLTIKGEGKITLSAVLPDGTAIPDAEITASVGSPVKKMTPMVFDVDEKDYVNSNKVELDFGQNNVAVDHPSQSVFLNIITTDDADDADNKTTDDIEWKSNNESVATVSADPTDPKNQAKAVITATDGIGKATITAKATSGKTAKFSVTVKATLIRIESVSISGDCAWSGKTEELIIERVPEQNRDKFKVTVTDPDTEEKSKLVKAKSTANIATITPANDLKLTSGGDDENNKDSITVRVTVESNDKYSEVEPKWADIIVKQSDFKFKYVKDDLDGRSMDEKEKKTVRTNPPFTEDEERVLEYTAEPDTKYLDAESVVSWVSSNVKVATVDDGKVKIVGQGTAKITASSVYKEKGKYKQIKKSFTVKSTPACERIELKSNTAAYNLSKKKAVTINVKQQYSDSSKKANDEIVWYVDGVKQTPSKNATDKKLVVQPAVFKGMQEGDTVEVMAMSKMNSSVYAVATIYVVKSAAKKVAFAEKYKKGVTLSVGATRSDIETPKIQSDPIVSYTVDKKGVGIVKVETIEKMTDDGELKEYLKLTGIGEGKATVTALTASGKKGTLKVTVGPATDKTTVE